MTYNAATESSPEKHTKFVQELTQQTVSALQNAKGNVTALQNAVSEYLRQATAASLELEEIEDILGVSETNIMDLASLCETDEEIVIDAFESMTAM